MNLQSEPRVIACVCTLGAISRRTVDSLIPLCASGKIAGWICVEGTLIPTSRNLAIEKAFEHDPDLTHILFIDDDMCNFDSNSLQRLLDHNLPIVGALAVSRKPPHQPICEISLLDNLKEKIQEKQVIEVDHCGMAFTLIKREVLNEVYEDTETGRIWFCTDRYERRTFQEEIEAYICTNQNSKESIPTIIVQAINFGRTARVGSPLMGEDVWFVHQAQRFGYKCYIDCGIPIGHLGLKDYTIFDFVEHLKKEYADGGDRQAIVQPVGV